MKSRLLIIIPIVVVIIVAIALIGITSDIGIGQKHQYKFGETTIKNENDQQFDRVFFSYSHDYGATFSESKDISMSENTWTGEPKMILMDDDVILVWREEIPPVHTLAFAISHDFGKTLEEKYLWHGSRPDIVHYNDVLYITWTDLENRQVLYSTSNDRGKTFEESKVIFAPTGEFSPYADKPTPKFAIDGGIVKITWNSQGEDYEYIIGEDLEIKNCPIGQTYNEVLFKCVVECTGDLVYNGYTNTCTTEFELKYHGYCNEGFTYSPSSHECNSDDGFQHLPLKDPPRTPPPEPEPEMTSRYEKYFDENNELNFGLKYDKNGVIIDDLQRIYDWCDYSGEKPSHWYFDWNNSTHHINSTDCEWIEK